jgi:tetratricopeptide (TPR) repeat protein
MLAPLARALGITIDELLSFEPELSDKDVMNFKQELTQIFMMSGYETGEVKCKKLLNEYPNNIFLKLTVAGLLQLHAMMPDDNDEELFKTRLRAILPLLENVASSKEIKHVSQALFSIATIQMMLENYEESEKVLDKLKTNYVDPMILYPQLLERQGKKEETKILCEQILLSRLNHCTAMLSILSRISLEEGDVEKAFTFIESIQKIEGLFDIGLSSGYYKLCHYYIKINNPDLAAKAFKTFLEEVISADYDYKNNQYFKDIKLEVNPDGQKIIRDKFLRSFLETPELKTLEGIKDYDDAIEILKNRLNET